MPSKKWEGEWVRGNDGSVNLRRPTRRWKFMFHEEEGIYIANHTFRFKCKQCTLLVLFDNNKNTKMAFLMMCFSFYSSTLYILLFILFFPSHCLKYLQPRSVSWCIMIDSFSCNVPDQVESYQSSQLSLTLHFYSSIINIYVDILKTTWDHCNATFLQLNFNLMGTFLVPCITEYR